MSKRNPNAVDLGLTASELQQRNMGLRRENARLRKMLEQARVGRVEWSSETDDADPNHITLHITVTGIGVDEFWLVDKIRHELVEGTKTLFPRANVIDEGGIKDEETGAVIRENVLDQKGDESQ